ncbi:MetQ/NlpA family ABC transporter substrate-binding protein [Sporolactobacillus sp. CPB3-1]|uniref:Lipoprotein n=1 Tax=Sporolactobacillus mangiferae TaxID=2940498 RepID=A0ABT0MDD9_9BACL|nr:MetQ/NlpA family ABC transporter substrate-binding protein [Sporolactobacillus mangiferae]MCL1632693.1 MetQ/NlpA family ABC transporter substrate-binding protein [Sporolactobacillus mangiferae]
MKQSKCLLIGVILIMTFALSACGNSTSGELSTKGLTVGVTGGPHEQIMEQVAKLAKKDGLTIHIKVFNDYNQPNTALDDGDLDASSYETLPFLKAQVKDRGYKITEVFKTVALPMGIYSNKIKDLKDLKNGDKIAIPNDPSSQPRSLTLLEKAGVIKMKPGTQRTGSTRDIISNPKKIKFVSMDPAQITAHLDEVTAAAINSNFAMGSGLTILKDSIYHESLTNNSYPNYFVVRNENKNDKVVKQIEKYYHSEQIESYIRKTFSGSVVPAW